MKALLFLLFTSILFAQTESANPDGKYISIHITPFLNTGSHFIDDDKTIDYEDKFNLAVLVKFPLGKSITLSPFYEKRTFLYLREEQVDPANEKTVEYYFKQSKAGITLSIYLNFF